MSRSNPAVRAAYSVGEFADLLDVTGQHVRNQIKLGRIKAIHVGRCLRIPATEVDRLLAASDGAA